MQRIPKRFGRSASTDCFAPLAMTLPGGYFRCSIFASVVSRRHFFSVAPDWSHATGTMMVALGDLRGFVGE
jgi:hypothetical protein